MTVGGGWRAADGARGKEIDVGEAGAAGRVKGFKAKGPGSGKDARSIDRILPWRVSSASNT